MFFEMQLLILRFAQSSLSENCLIDHTENALLFTSTVLSVLHKKNVIGNMIVTIA